MKNKRISALIDAITHNHVKKVAKLLKQGIDPNVCEDEQLFSPLHWAAAHSGIEIAQLLLDAGANSQAKDWEGFTPLETACLFRNRPYIRFYHEYQRNNAVSKHKEVVNA